VVRQTEPKVDDILLKVAKTSRVGNRNTGHFIARGQVAELADISGKAHICSCTYGWVVAAWSAALHGAAGVGEGLRAAVTVFVSAMHT
jgi:hypothetical protein